MGQQQVKRRRGRPRKAEAAAVEVPEVSLDEEEEIEEEQEQQPVVQKKKRGRPRKCDQISPRPPESEQKIERKRRGRPRKEEQVEVPKRKRGRPRKEESTVEPAKKRGRSLLDKVESPRSVESVNKVEEKIYYQPEIDLFATPSYPGFSVPQVERNDEIFEAESLLERIEGRETWISLLPELVMVCNEAARRATVAQNPNAKFFDKPLAADYMYDRLALSLDEPRGYVCRHRESSKMQGFIVLSVFASWDKTLRWSSNDPRAWGVTSYDAYASRRSGSKTGTEKASPKPKQAKSTDTTSLTSLHSIHQKNGDNRIVSSPTEKNCMESDDSETTSIFDRSTLHDDDDDDDDDDQHNDESEEDEDNDDLVDDYDSDSVASDCSLSSLRGILGRSRLKKSERTECELKIGALIDAADAAAAVALKEYEQERRDENGVLSQAIESTQRQVSELDDRFLEWPQLLEITLLGGLGCGRRLIETAIKTFCAPGQLDQARKFIVLQATHNAVHFYEKRGFIRVGAVAKYRDRRDMPELAYRHWNDRITVGSQVHGASHMMALDLDTYKTANNAGFNTTTAKKMKSTPNKRKKLCASPEISRDHVALIAEAAMTANTNVVGGSSVFRELVVLAQGHAGKYGANDQKLERALATSLLVFKSNSCGTSKRILRTQVLHLPDEPPSVTGSRRNSGLRNTAIKAKLRTKGKVYRDSIFIRLQLSNIDTRPRLQAQLHQKSTLHNVVLSTRLVAKVSDKQTLFYNIEMQKRLKAAATKPLLPGNNGALSPSSKK